MSFRLTTQKVLFASSLIMSGYVLTANAEDPATTVQTPPSVPSATLPASTDGAPSAQTTNNTKAAEAEPAATPTSTGPSLTEQPKMSNEKETDEKETKQEVKENLATSTNVNAATPESTTTPENITTPKNITSPENITTPQQKETVAVPTETTATETTTAETTEDTKTPDVAPAAKPSPAFPSITEQPKELDKKEIQAGEAAATSASSATAESTSVSENIATAEKKEAVTTTPTVAKEFKLDSEEQKRAYASGIALGHYIEAQIAQQKELHITLDKNIMLAGVADAFNNQEKMSEKEVRDTLLILDEQINVLAEDKNNKRIAADKTWMEQFAQREGVKKNKQGLLYLIINKGSGPALQSTDVVELSFKGTLIDGTVVDGPKVDNSYQVFKVDNIPPLLRDSVKLIRKGGEIQVAIPPSAIKVPDGSKKPEFVVIYTISVIDVNKPQ
ncbi:FKBP-type peptidyl-prolyl cis-trans isomerase N-terminal domain-containing protein [Serratia sp. DD3]|uniref:FKBP-type peptidyl-prolyl cis-trans isomerase N-terminal domain-containing protein n=1 Tax=Serratia sp. DD3 TaxID=1410619 RepID=UPI0004D3D540|nr:FKBP-type peptidyl-prolyl cis-trans isomerase N-terminal domain-containing protein [Serratia sp. DD3]KEY56596.1 FKBP-type peptidyl-prolyl cis-trans isomerase FkpA [Serratia sp. DD3]KEY56816.1 FKBP-type peptidyl-prolyl cis-trans isomerase FkpA [Serratia sp. DD3]KEY58251.1 FKBP-type peptidyl-prolyl cis-trans isomerase FkpA [Serratia sp. DD3]KEY59527.1 FKBP-type peptidyl-prolyl cis-trans isomerase FkpA [Serratia sp. DD3]